MEAILFLAVCGLVVVGVVVALATLDPEAWWHDKVHGKHHPEDDLDP
jgi:hypothetical protein